MNRTSTVLATAAGLQLWSSVSLAQASVTIQGQVEYVDRPQTIGDVGTGNFGYTGVLQPKPVRFAYLQVYRSGTVFDTPVGTLHQTGPDGSFSVPLSLSGSPPHSLFVRIWSENQYANVHDMLFNQTHQYDSPAAHVASSGSIWLDGDPHDQLNAPILIHTPEAAGAFNILDVMTDGGMYAEQYIAGTIPTLMVQWQRSRDPIRRLTVYDGSVQRVYVKGRSNQDEFNDHTLLHEYAHYIQDILDPTDHCTGPVGHQYCTPSSTDTAYREGVADWFSCAVRNDSLLIRVSEANDLVNGIQWFDLESRSQNGLATCDEGDDVQASTSSFLWDLIDPANEPEDTVSHTMQQVFNAAFRASQCNLESFCGNLNSVSSGIARVASANGVRATSCASTTTGSLCGTVDAECTGPALCCDPASCRFRPPGTQCSFPVSSYDCSSQACSGDVVSYTARRTCTGLSSLCSGPEVRVSQTPNLFRACSSSQVCNAATASCVTQASCTAPVCGDGVCAGTESASSCAADCCPGRNDWAVVQIGSSPELYATEGTCSHRIYSLPSYQALGSPPIQSVSSNDFNRCYNPCRSIDGNDGPLLLVPGNSAVYQFTGADVRPFVNESAYFSCSGETDFSRVFSHATPELLSSLGGVGELFCDPVGVPTSASCGNCRVGTQRCSSSCNPTFSGCQSQCSSSQACQSNTCVTSRPPPPPPPPTGSPNLSVEAPSVSPIQVYTGQAFTMTARVRNSGNADAPPTRLNAYRSSDTLYNQGDTRVGTFNLGILRAGASQNITLTYSARSVPIGQYYIVFRADAYDEVSESNENDNTASAPQLRVPAPNCHVGNPGDINYCHRNCPCAEGQGDCSGDDQCQGSLRCMNSMGPIFGYRNGSDVCLPGTPLNLRVLDVTPIGTSFASGSDPVSATVRIQNTASVLNPIATSVEFYLSTDATYSSDDDYIDRQPLPAIIQPGEIVSVTTNRGYFNREKPLGPYYVVALLDRFDDVPETDESDNTGASSTPVQLVFGNVCAPNAYFGEGNTCYRCNPNGSDRRRASDSRLRDNDPCTADLCSPIDGSVMHPPAPNGTPCDDLNPGTGADACIGGVCAGAPIVCVAGLYLPVGGLCRYCNTSGTAYEPYSEPIDDQNPCTVDSCEQPSGALHAPVADGSACDDDDPTTVGDSCQAGQCIGQPLICTPGEYTADATGSWCHLCDSTGTTLLGSGFLIPDASPCTTDSCDPQVGIVHTPLADNTTCDDQNSLTTGDRCVAGICQGQAPSCTPGTRRVVNGSCHACDPSTLELSTPGEVLDDGSECTVDACDDALGVTHTAAPAGTPCDDGDAATAADQCLSAGVCQGIPSAPRVDVALHQVAVAGGGVLGAPVPVTVSLQNLGNQVVGPVSVELRLSSDPTFEPTDMLLCTRTVAEVPAAGYATVPLVCNVPMSAGAGAQHVVAMVDANQAVLEEDESNNAASTPITLHPSGADADADGIADAADFFPCDGAAAAQAFTPAEAAYGMVQFEDEWPLASDLDFNDVVVAYTVADRRNVNGRVSRISATFDVLAVGGVFTNGLGWQLPIPTSAVRSVSRQVGTNPLEQLSPLPTETSATIRIADNLRSLFGGQANQINSDPVGAPLRGVPVTIVLDLTTPIDLQGAIAPFDLFIFRTGDPSHEIHRPEFAGTSLMNAGLFGTGIDASSTSRAFVDAAGLPFVLTLPDQFEYPAEGVGIATLFPQITTFAASAGATGRDFYTRAVNTAAAYPNRLAPTMWTAEPVDTSCIGVGQPPSMCPALCTPDATRCSASNLERCSPDGCSWTTEQACQAGCSNGACVPPATTCPSTCTPGATRCGSAGGVEVCAADGCGWSAGQQCNCGCSNGACNVEACTVGSRQCSSDGSLALVCAFDGTACGWQPLEACSCGCATGQCQSLTCTPGQPMVDQEYVTTAGGLEITQRQDVVQTFTVGQRGILANVQAIGIRHHRCTPSVDLTIELYQTAGGRAVGSPLIAMSVPPSHATGGTTLTLDTSPLNLLVHPGDVYGVGLRSNAPGSSCTYVWNGVGADNYPGGQAVPAGGYTTWEMSFRTVVVP